MKGNFGISDTEYIAIATPIASESIIPHAIYSNVREDLQQQHYTFDILWNTAIPVPPGEFVTNFENSFGLISGFIPEPVSLILTLASLFLFSALIVISLLASLVVNFIALPNKFDITSLILTLSALMKIGSGGCVNSS